MSSNTAVVNLTAQITALASALGIVPDASPQAVQTREQVASTLDKRIHDVLEEGVRDNADGGKTIRAALLGWSPPRHEKAGPRARQRDAANHRTLKGRAHASV